MAIPVLQDNTPAAGSIAWPLFHIQYDGVGYEVVAGSTAERWTWWRFNGGTPLVESGPTVPQDLTEDDVVLFGNNNGTGIRIQNATLIDGELLVDGTVVATKLHAEAVTTEHLLAANALIEGLLQVKEIVAEAVETEGLTIAGDQTWNETTGFTIPDVVNFPPNNLLDAYVKAWLIARKLTIEDFFKMRGTHNEFSAGAKAVMADGITPPDGAPAQEAAWEQVAQFSVPEGTGVLRGIVRESTNTWVTMVTGLGSFGNDCQLVRFVDGVEVKRSPILTVTDGAGGFCRHPTTGDYYVSSNPSWYSNSADGGANAESFWNIEIVSADLNSKIGSWSQPTSRQVGFSSPGVRFTSDDTQIYPYSSTKVMIAGKAESRLHGLTWDWTDFGQGSAPRADAISITLSDRNPPTESFQGLTKGKPPGNDQLTSAPVAAGYWTAWFGGVDPFLNGADIPTVQRAFGKSVRGAWHDGTYHYTLDSGGKVYRYERYNLTGQVGYTWRDTLAPMHETPVSPPATITVPRGAGVLVTPDAPPYTGDPDSPDVSQVFARVSSGDPWRNHGPGTPTKFIGVVDGAASIYGSEGIESFATAGISPFEWVSQKLNVDSLPMIRLKGNGEFRLGDIKSEGTDGRFEFPKVTLTTSGTYTRGVDLVRIGQVVFCSGDVDRPGGGFNSSFHATGLIVPVGFRPPANKLTGFVANSGATATHRARFNVDGTVEIQESAAITSFMNLDTYWVTEDA